MSKAPVHTITVPTYTIPKVDHFSGEKHYTEFGTPVPIEYWKDRPDFAAISIPIVDFLRQHFMNQKIGIRMLGSMKHPDRNLEELILTIQALGHDRYDPQQADNQYNNADLFKTELFMLEIQLGVYDGINGEEQIEHALRSLYVASKSPTRVDIVIIYDLSKFEHIELVFAGRKEIGHAFKYPERKSEAILAILKLV